MPEFCDAEIFFHHRSSGLPFRGTFFVLGLSPVQQDRAGSTPTINLTMEQKHIIKETVKELKIEEWLPISKWLLAKRYRKPSNYIQCRHNFPKKISHVEESFVFSQCLSGNNLNSLSQL